MAVLVYVCLCLLDPRNHSFQETSEQFLPVYLSYVGEDLSGSDEIFKQVNLFQVFSFDHKHLVINVRDSGYIIEQRVVKFSGMHLATYRVWSVI